MNTACGFLFSLSMVFVTVSSTSIIPGEEPSAVCNKSVDRTEIRQVPHEVSYESRTWWTFFIFTKTVTETIYKPEAHNVSVVEPTCCEGYKNQSGVCEAQCSPECENGNCTQPNFCSCNYGWKGDSCKEPFSCVVRSNLTDEPQIRDVEIVEQVQECHDQSGRRALNSSDRDHVNVVSCRLPLNCFEISADGFQSASWEKYVSFLFLVVGISLFSMAIHTVYTVRRTRRAKKKNKDDVRELSDFSLNYMVDNTIYS